MTYDYRMTTIAQLASIRLSAAEHREAIDYVQRSEAMADLIFWVASLPRRAVAGITNFFRNAKASEVA